MGEGFLFSTTPVHTMNSAPSPTALVCMVIDLSVIGHRFGTTCPTTTPPPTLVGGQRFSERKETWMGRCPLFFSECGCGSVPTGNHSTSDQTKEPHSLRTLWALLIKMGGGSPPRSCALTNWADRRRQCPPELPTSSPWTPRNLRWCRFLLASGTSRRKRDRIPT